MEFSRMDTERLTKIKAELEKKYNDFKDRGLKLDMSRGKPATEQLDMVSDILDVLGKDDYKTPAGVDCRNYGIPLGINEIRQLFAEVFGVQAKNVIVGGNSSLNMMYDCISQGMTHGFGEGPWCEVKNRKFLCPCPGYDRHFAVTEYFGFELIPVKMLATGPDMDEIRRLCENDPTVKGVWCVPKYSNPTGITYSKKVVEEFAALKPAAKDFRIFWDNSYFIHDLNDTSDRLYNIFDACKQTGNEDIVLSFTSTSKITFPGSGVAALAASDFNISLIEKRIAVQTIGPDKINQLRHLKYFVDLDGMKLRMRQHAAKIKPKFEIVLNAFNKELAGKEIAHWTTPNGGYFISLDVMPGCAKRVQELCSAAGVTLTPAGSAFPYGHDPNDDNIRIAPSFPLESELKDAVELLCIAIQLAACEKLIKSKGEK